MNTPNATRQRTVLITGGSSGIGAATARMFARRGDEVWLTYHRGRDRAEALVAELAEGSNITPRTFALDQGDWESIRATVDALPGPVDVLVNNAALGTRTVEHCGAGAPHEQDERLTRVNMLGPLWLTRLLVPGMVERGYGKVITVSSVGGGIAVFPGFREADAMSKAAVAFLTRHLAAQLCHDPVDIFCVCPGGVNTPMAASTLDPLPAETAAAIVSNLPLSRLIEPEEIAAVIGWLAGPEARVLHGAVIDASLGLGTNPGLLTTRFGGASPTSPSE